MGKPPRKGVLAGVDTEFNVQLPFGFDVAVQSRVDPIGGEFQPGAGFQQPGGKIEVMDQELPAGETVEVIVLRPTVPASGRRSAVDVLAEAPGQRLFKTAADVRAYLQHEREAWER